MPSPRIYLDNAATSWPKPESVYRAVDRYQRDIGVAAGRGSYASAESIERVLRQTRVAVAEHLRAPDGGEIVFAFNCTDAINSAIHGILQPGDHVVSSVAEHNSILRPLAAWKARGVETTYVNVDELGRIDLTELQSAVRPATKLIAITHASNVTGALQPLDEIANVARSESCFLMVDAAQTLGHVEIDVSHQIDILAAPGHKGLLGPLGTGILYLSPRAAESVESTRQGGTGTQSELAEQPSALPARLESGNLNVPGLLGLDAGLRYVTEHQLAGGEQLRTFTTELVSGLAPIRSVQLYSSPNPCGIVSFNISGYDPRELASMLDSSGGFEVRAGFHCAPWMHRALGTLSSGGTVRASFGHFNTETDVQRLLDLLTSIADSSISP